MARLGLPLEKTLDSAIGESDGVFEVKMKPMEQFESLLDELREACQVAYGDRLISLVVFGSVGRRLPRPDSDIDLLLIVDSLPDGRLCRVREFDKIEKRLQSALEKARDSGVDTRFSPIFKTPDEVRMGSPLFLDMIEDAWALFDREGFFASTISALKERLRGLGARRIWRGDFWYWDLKSDFKPGEVFEF